MSISQNPSAYAASIYPTKGDRHLDVFFENVKQAKLDQLKLKEDAKKKQAAMQAGLSFDTGTAKVWDQDRPVIDALKKKRDDMAIAAYKRGEDYTDPNSPSFRAIKDTENELLSLAAASAQQYGEYGHKLGVIDGDQGKDLDTNQSLVAANQWKNLSIQERTRMGSPKLTAKPPVYDRQAYIKAQQGQIEKPSTRMEDVKGAKSWQTRTSEITEYTPEQAAIGGMKFLEGSPQEQGLIAQEFAGLSESQKLDYAEKAQKINEKGTVPGEVLPEAIYAQEKYLPQYNVKDQKWQQRNVPSFIINPPGQEKAVKMEWGDIQSYKVKVANGSGVANKVIHGDIHLNIQDDKIHTFNLTSGKDGYGAYKRDPVVKTKTDALEKLRNPSLGDYAESGGEFREVSGEDAQLVKGRAVGISWMGFDKKTKKIVTYDSQEAAQKRKEGVILKPYIDIIDEQGNTYQAPYSQNEKYGSASELREKAMEIKGQSKSPGKIEIPGF